MQESVKKLAETFFSHLGISYESLDVIVQDVDRHIYMLKVQTDDSALLIGSHGRSREEIQWLLSHLLEREYDTYPIIHLEVNDYLEARDARLYSLVDNKVVSVKKNGGIERITDLNGYERKKVHDYVDAKNIKGLTTYSKEDEQGTRVLHLSYEWEIDIDEQIDIDAVEI